MFSEKEFVHKISSYYAAKKKSVKERVRARVRAGRACASACVRVGVCVRACASEERACAGCGVASANSLHFAARDEIFPDSNTGKRFCSAR